MTDTTHPADAVATAITTWCHTNLHTSTGHLCPRCTEATQVAHAAVLADLGDPASYDWRPTAQPVTECAPLSFTGKACANPAPRPHRCYGATSYVADDHDASEGVHT